MKQILAITILLTLAIGCKPNQPPPAPTNSILQGMVSGGCDVETEISNQAGASICQTTGCPSATACEGFIAGNWGALNLCQIPIPDGVTAVLLKVSSVNAKEAAQWKTIGDIPKSALGATGAQRLASLQALGLIGAVVCPLADGLLLGVFTAQIPPLCQGPNPLSATGANAAFKLACQAVTATLP